MTLIRIALLLAAAAIAASWSPAFAQSSPTLVQARSAGQIGERYDGFLGFVATPSEALRRQVNAVNIRRRALYRDLATRKGVTSEEVGITAACSLLRRVAVGEYYLPPQGSWQRRAAGQAAPVPSYCG